MVEPFDTVDVIRTKRDGQELSTAQIQWVIDAYTRDWVTSEQMAALAMAVFLKGMNQREIFDWTQAMIDSGQRLDFGSLPRPTADKHSTGGGQDHLAASAAGGKFRRGRTAAFRARLGTHGRYLGQAGGHSRLAG